MQSTRKKISNMASAAKEHLIICKAKVEEKVEKASARTAEQKEIAKERRKAKEAQAKMELHQAKAKHAAEKFSGKRSHHLPGHHHYQHPSTIPTNNPVVGTQANQPLGSTVTVAGTTAPAYPMGGHPPGYKHI